MNERDTIRLNKIHIIKNGYFETKSMSLNIINSYTFNSEFMNKLLNPLMKFTLFLRYKNKSKYF